MQFTPQPEDSVFLENRSSAIGITYEAGVA